MAQLADPPHTAGTDACALRQSSEIHSRWRDQHIPSIGTWRERGQRHILRQRAGKVFGAVHGQINAPGTKCVFDGGDEQSRPADFP